MMFCSIYRLLISSALDGDKPLSRTLQSHVDNCPRCSIFHKRSVEIGSALSSDRRDRSSAAATAAAVSKIFEAAAESSPVIPMPRNYSKHYAAAAAVLIVACVGFVMHRNSQAIRPGDWRPVARAIDDVRNAGQTFAAPLAPTSSPASLSYAMSKPMASELDGLNNRTLSAVRFLIDCTPYKLPRSAQGHINN